MQDVILGQYVPGDSAVHRIEPRVKIIAGLLWSIGVFGASGWPAYLILTLYGGAAAQIARVPFGFLWRGLRPLLLLIVVAALLHLFFTPGEILWQAGALRLSQEGVVGAGRMIARLVLLLTGISLITLTTTPLALSGALERLLSPLQKLGVPAHEIAMMTTIALRFVPVLAEELDKIVKAQMARGADFGDGGIVRRMRSMMPLLVPLFVSVFRRAEELGVAMEARGYRGGAGRSRMTETVVGPTDWFVLAGTAVVCLGVLWF